MVAAVNNNHAFAAVATDVQYALAGHDYFKTGNWNAALAQFNAAININPNVCGYRYMRAACYANLGMFPQSLAEYNTALNFAANNIDRANIHFDLALLADKMNDEEQVLFHIVAAARFGHLYAQQLCKEYGFPY